MQMLPALAPTRFIGATPLAERATWSLRPETEIAIRREVEPARREAGVRADSPVADAPGRRARG